MSALAIGQAAQAILAAAIQGVAPGTSVLLGHPDNFNDDVILYLYHYGIGQDIDKGPGIVWRTHQFAVHLMVRTQADRVTTEATYLAIHDVASNAFYSSAAVRALDGAAMTSQIGPLSGGGGQTPYAVTAPAGEYRQGWWLLEARDQFVFSWRA